MVSLDLSPFEGTVLTVQAVQEHYFFVSGNDACLPLYNTICVFMQHSDRNWPCGLCAYTGMRASILLEP